MKNYYDKNEFKNIRNEKQILKVTSLYMISDESPVL